MLGIKPNRAPIQGQFAKKLREEIAIARAERERARGAQPKAKVAENPEK
jgi:hypothetical protein